MGILLWSLFIYMAYFKGLQSNEAKKMIIYWINQLKTVILQFNTL